MFPLLQRVDEGTRLFGLGTEEVQRLFFTGVFGRARTQLPIQFVVVLVDLQRGQAAVVGHNAELAVVGRDVEIGDDVVGRAVAETVVGAGLGVELLDELYGVVEPLAVPAVTLLYALVLVATEEVEMVVHHPYGVVLGGTVEVQIVQLHRQAFL